MDREDVRGRSIRRRRGGLRDGLVQFGAFLGFFGFGTLAILWVWTTYRGVPERPRRDFAEHQAWMIRSFVADLRRADTALWLIVLTVVQQPFGLDEQS